MAPHAKKAKGTEVAIIDPAKAGNITTNALTIGGRKFSVTKQVTVPQLKQVENQPIAFKITGRMYIGQKLKSEKDKDRKPPTMIDVIELTSGRAMKYIVPAVLKRRFEEEYDGDLENPKAKHTYVGKSFGVMAGPLGHTKDGSRQLREMQVVEIEDDGEVA